MTATTPILGIEHPLDTDNPNTYGIHTALQNMAEDIDVHFGAWTAWTPTIGQGATGNITKTVNVARYWPLGKHIRFEFRCTMTGTGTAANKVTVQLPVVSKHNGLLVCGWGGVEDVSATQDWQRPAYIDAGGNGNIVFRATAGLLGVSSFTAALAAGDIVWAKGFYERS